MDSRYTAGNLANHTNEWRSIGANKIILDIKSSGNIRVTEQYIICKSKADH